MRKFEIWRVAGPLCVGLFTSATLAQESQEPSTAIAQATEKSATEEADKPATDKDKAEAEGHYRIGVSLQPLSDAVRAQVDIPDDQGLQVAEVLDDFPAAKASIKPHDILLRINDEPITSIETLSKTLDKGKEQEVTLTLLRKGKIESLKVTPKFTKDAATQVTAAYTIAGAPNNAWIQQLQGQPGFPVFTWNQAQALKLGDMQLIAPQPGVQWNTVGPAVVFSGADGLGTATISATAKVFMEIDDNDLKIKLERDGQNSAKISVTRGKDSWDIREGEYDKLPEDLRKLPVDLRAIVQSMVDGIKHHQVGVGHRIMNLTAPGLPGAVRSFTFKSDPNAQSGVEIPMLFNQIIPNQANTQFQIHRLDAAPQSATLDKLSQQLSELQAQVKKLEDQLKK